MIDEPPSRSFEAFNARFLSAEEVAKTFIPPAQYWRLLEANHSILLGPRGSGKTTLLKMLQLRSLASWSHSSAAEAVGRLGFHAIFLGTDVLWGSQLEARTAAIASEEVRTNIRRASFRIHLSLAFLNALEECRDPAVREHPVLGKFGVDFDRESEVVLAKGLASIWGLDPSLTSLLALRVGLREQLTMLLVATSKIRDDETSLIPDFVHLDPVASAVSAIDIANAVFGQPERRWAILCDELEIAPDMIRKELFQVLRSSLHNVLFKFSLFPYSSELAAMAGPDAPTANNDFAPLDLTYGKRESAYDFCAALFQGLVAQAGGKPLATPEEALGDGWFDGGRSHRRQKTSPYAPPQGEFYRRAVALSHIDAGFRNYLKRTRIDLRTVHQLSDGAQAPFRKALPFILTRSEFLKEEGNRRSRKASRLYTGTFSLFSLTEGNPRVFINLMRPLVAEYVAKGGTIPVELQVSSAETTIHRFKASLAAIPTTGRGEVRTVLDLIEVIGRHLEVVTLDDEFSAEPPTTILVDDQVSPGILEILGRALNAGAFVRMPEAGDVGMGEIVGSRLRLAYTLAPEYKLPLVAGRSVHLSTIVRAHLNASRRDPTQVRQARLPFGIE